MSMHGGGSRRAEFLEWEMGGLEDSDSAVAAASEVEGSERDSDRERDSD